MRTPTIHAVQTAARQRGGRSLRGVSTPTIRFENEHQAIAFVGDYLGSRGIAGRRDGLMVEFSIPEGQSTTQA